MGALRHSASLAQLVEQLTLNQFVRGSSPRGGTSLRVLMSAPKASLAQLVEQLTLNQFVRGSSPRGGTQKRIGTPVRFFSFNLPAAMTAYAQSYVVIGSVMLFILFCAYLYIVWQEDTETRRSGYCMLAVGAVFCVLGLYMLYACDVAPSEVFRSSRRSMFSTRRYDTTNLMFLMGIWVIVSYMGGKGLYKTLVNMGVLREESEADDDEA